MYRQDLIRRCHELCKKNLINNSTSYGVLAASRKSREGNSKNYTSLFSRDVGVCVLGMLASKEEELINIARVSLESLTQAQSELGQFPFYYQPENKVIRWWNPGVIDGTIWWAIAFLKYFEYTKDQKFYKKYQSNLERAFIWLRYQDTNNDGLLEQGEASDWADEMPRMGAVLYTNALWFWLIRLRIEIERKKDLKKLKDEVYEAFNTVFWVHKNEDNTINYLPQNSYVEKNINAVNVLEHVNVHAVYLPYYLGFVSHKTFEMRCDVYGNILACLAGLADDKIDIIIDFIIRAGINQPYPIKVLYPPIYPGEKDWKEYMEKGRQNYPWQYHNGGIWPYIGGFWVALLAKVDKAKAQEELAKLAEANSLNEWEFNEYLHGQLGTPMGVTFQSWNMASFLYAFHALNP